MWQRLSFDVSNGTKPAKGRMIFLLYIVFVCNDLETKERDAKKLCKKWYISRAWMINEIEKRDES
jgi:hypothetical protein